MLGDRRELREIVVSGDESEQHGDAGRGGRSTCAAWQPAEHSWAPTQMNPLLQLVPSTNSILPVSPTLLDFSHLNAASFVCSAKVCF